MIRDKDITFVVQGPVIGNMTESCLLSVRRYFPYSKIIFSTWKDEDLSGLVYDDVIKNPDPGALGSTYLPLRNINRQIVSTLNGLRSVKSKYVVKLRSDTLLISKGFLYEYDKYDGVEKTDFFSSRVLTTFGFSPSREKALFFIGDFFMFGKTKDLLQLWDVPLFSRIHTSGSIIISPEQYIWFSFFRKKHGMRNVIKFDSANILFYERFISRNLIFLYFDDIGIRLLKYPFANFVEKMEYQKYTKCEWLVLYFKYTRHISMCFFDLLLFIKHIHKFFIRVYLFCRHYLDILMNKY